MNQVKIMLRSDIKKEQNTLLMIINKKKCKRKKIEY